MNGEKRRRGDFHRRRVLAAACAAALVCILSAPSDGWPQYMRKTLIAHRGASSYAPENTLPAYLLALEQGSEYVEQDLQVTKDGVLICLHDLTLERTTDVEEVFPTRYREVERAGKTVREWPVSDFTLEEIKRLDAGSWFDARFAGTKVPTWQEAIESLRGKAGLYPETKAPEFYGNLGFDMERLVLKVLSENGLDQPGADPKTPVIIQSFSAESLRKMARDMKVKLPLVLLVGPPDAERWLTREALREARQFVVGIAPAKRLLLEKPEVVGWAREVGLSVTSYTFRSADTGSFPDVRAEMAHYLHTLGIDALFTDNPDRFPR